MNLKGGGLMAVVVAEQINRRRTYTIPCDQIETVHSVIAIAPPADDDAVPVADWLATH